MLSSRKTFLQECQGWQGMFESERVVRFEIDGTTYTTIADREDVELDGTLQENSYVEGRLRVYQVEKRGEKAFVILPREAAGHGRRLLVPLNLLQHA